MAIMDLTRLPRRTLLALALPLALLACEGGDDATSQGGGGSGATGGGGAGATDGGATSSGGSGGSGAAGATGGGGSGPVGQPYAFVGSEDGKIRILSLNKQDGSLTAVSDVDAGNNPSFLAFAPDKAAVYSVDESSDELRSFAIGGPMLHLTPLSSVSANGGGPAHIAVDATGKYVFGVNYGGGNITMIAVNADGSLGDEVTTLDTGENAHQLVLDPSNAFAFVPNKGSDTVSQLVFSAAAGTLVFNQPASVSLPGGAGPRHMVFHPSAAFAYVINELSDSVTAFPYDAQKGTLGASFQSVSTLPGGQPSGNNTCAEIAFGASGEYLYGSNRGDDSIVIFSVDAQGSLTLVGHEKTGGSTPRHFSIEESGEIMLVGNQGSNDVTTFRIDPDKGTLTKLLTTPFPAGVSFVGVIYL